jgi:hypothetical protein
VFRKGADVLYQSARRYPNPPPFLILFGHPPEFNGHLFLPRRAGVERTQFGKLDFGVSRRRLDKRCIEKKIGERRAPGRPTLPKWEIAEQLKLHCRQYIGPTVGSRAAKGVRFDPDRATLEGEEI